MERPGAPLESAQGQWFLVSTVGLVSEEDARGLDVHAVGMRMQPSAAGLGELAGLLNTGTIRAIVSGTYPLSQASRAWTELLTGHPRGKIVLEIPA